MTQERVNLVNEIITKIAYKNQYKFKTLSVDDISQSLWVKILTKEQEVGELDINLIIHICYDYIVDLQRFEMKRNHYSLDDENEEFLLGNMIESDFDNSIICKVIFDQLLDKYPEDTPEGVSLRWWMTESNFKDFGYYPDGNYNDGYTDKNLAKLLGFEATSGSAYRRLRKEIREAFEKFLKDSDSE